MIQGVPSAKWRSFNSGKRFFEIVADQCNCQIGGALDNARSEFAQRLAQFRFPLNINRVNANTALFKILFRFSKRHPQTCPIGGHCAAREFRLGNDIAAIKQSLQGFLDLLGWKILLQHVHDVLRTLSVLGDQGADRNIE